MRILMWFSIGFVAACGLGAYAAGSWLWAVCLAALILAAGLLIWSKGQKTACISGLLCLGLAVGLLWDFAFVGLQLSPLEAYDGEMLELTVTARDYAWETDYGQALDGEVTLNGRRFAIRAYVVEKTTIAPGDTVTGTFRLERTFDGSNAPYYHKGDGIYLLAYPASEITHQKGDFVPLSLLPALWRADFLALIDRLFPADAAGFARALVLGDRSGIDYALDTAFSISGISHVISVSGLHVSILFALIYLLSGRNRWLCALLGIPALVTFAAIVGFTPSITRACIMQGLMLLAMLWDRDYDSPTALAFAALCILAHNPLAITSVSFQLSFGCMVGIFGFSDRIYHYILAGKKQKGFLGGARRWFAASISITLGANLVTVPLIAIYFGNVSLIGIVTNLVTLWLVSFLFYGVLIACVLSLILPAAGIAVAWVTSWGIRLVIWLCTDLSKIPFAAVYTASPYIVTWLIALYVLILCFLHLKKKQVPLLTGCAVGLLCLSLVASWVEPKLDDCRVTVLDVGQGQAIVLQTPSRAFLVDCGGDSEEESADTVAEYLQSQGIFCLDGIILTHYDKDHVGGIPNLLTRMQTKAVFLPAMDCQEALAAQIAEQAGELGIYVENDILVRFDDCEIQIFGPENDADGNENSICVLFQAGNCDILITGDRGTEGELALLKHGLPELEVLIAGHHGAASATSQALLEALCPEYVFISVGRDNRYGHPKQEVLDRLAAAGCKVCRTDLQGTILYRG